MTDPRARRFAVLIFAAGLSGWGALAPRSARAEPCISEPSGADAEGDATALLDRARDLDERGQGPRAAAVRAMVATKWPKDPRAKEAGARALESFAEGDMRTCLEPIAALANEIESKVCSSPADPECVGIARLIDDMLRLRAEKLVERAQKAPDEAARRLFLDAGATYENLFVSRLRGPCERAEPRCARAEEVLFNAARAHRAGRDLEAALRALELLASPQFRFSGELVSRGILEQGNAYLGTASYEAAASRFERFADTSPKSESAPTALTDAIVLRIGLGHLDRAQADSDLFIKLYGNRQRDSARLAIALAHALEQRGDERAVLRHLEPRMGVVQKAAPGLTEEAAMLLVRAYRATKRGDRAKKLAEKVAASSVSLPPREIDDPDERLAIGRRMTAIGEARVFVADDASADALSAPTKKDDAEGIAKKKKAVDDAERLYARVFELAFTPPAPTVDAAAAIAQLRARLFAQAFLALGEERAEPAFAEALAANRQCLALSIKLEHRTERARACERWLLRHDPKETKPDSPLPPRLFRSTVDTTAPSPDRTLPPPP